MRVDNMANDGHMEIDYDKEQDLFHIKVYHDPDGYGSIVVERTVFILALQKLMKQIIGMPVEDKSGKVIEMKPDDNRDGHDPFNP